jgi:hypothetical protein
MGRHQRSGSLSVTSSATPSSDATELDFAAAADVSCPFGRVDALGPVELRETAYEIFFMSCRSSSGGNTAGAAEVSSPVAGPRGGGGSRVKKALGLKARRLSSSSAAMVAQPMMVRTLSQTSGPASPGRGRRPMTSAEIMRQQMRVTEQSDARLRRTLMRAVVGQVGRRPDTIVLPLELLRQLKPAEFADGEEYHQWQFRQVKLLEAGLILHPSLPLDRLNSAVLRFREVMRATEIRAIDTAKSSDAMRTLTSAVHALAWRSGVGSGGGDACHWADGYPLNVLLYASLLHAIFDHRDCTVVLDEVDELLDLIRKTWPTLGVTRPVHNVCLAWAFFQQYVVTGQVEPELAAAALAVLADVAADARGTRDAVYGKALLGALGAMQEWSEKRLLDYHDSYEKGIGGAPTEGMEILLSISLAAGKIIADPDAAADADDAANFAGDRVDYYIRCSMKNAFTKVKFLGSESQFVLHQFMFVLIPDSRERNGRRRRRAGGGADAAGEGHGGARRRGAAELQPGAEAVAPGAGGRRGGHPARLLRRRAEAVPRQGDHPHGGARPRAPVGEQDGEGHGADDGGGRCRLPRRPGQGHRRRHGALRGGFRRDGLAQGVDGRQVQDHHGLPRQSQRNRGNFVEHLDDVQLEKSFFILTIDLQQNVLELDTKIQR